VVVKDIPPQLLQQRFGLSETELRRIRHADPLLDKDGNDDVV
jgi:hypothetical protein